MLGALTEQAATAFGDAVAVVADDEILSFADVDLRASTFAGGLRDLGVARGDRVVLHLANGWRWIVAYYAIQRLGAVVVPANILLSADEVAYMAVDAQAVAAICPGGRSDAIRGQLAVDALPTFVVTGDPTTAERAFDDVLRGAPAPVTPVTADDLAAICYTSGTTGRPKGARLSQRAVFMSAALTATTHVRRPGEVVVSALPLPHVYGNIVLHCGFICGMTLVVLERFEAGAAIAAIAKHRATLFEGVPTMYAYMLSHPSLPSADLSSLTRCTVGGQTIPNATIAAVEAAFGCPLLELWGMTEVAGPAISHSPYLPRRPGSIGLPFAGMQARIVSLEGGLDELPTGENGELVVRGPLLMDGYHNNPEGTAEALGSGWFRTGDIARQDPDGYLFIVDRKKDLIITAGYNIYPAELEQIIAEHPSVAMVAVASVADDVKGELAKAFVVLRPGATLSTETLLQHCRQRLASYKVPRLVEFVEDLPKTSTGKILRRALRDNHAAPERQSEKTTANAS